MNIQKQNGLVSTLNLSITGQSVRESKGPISFLMCFVERPCWKTVDGQIDKAGHAKGKRGTGRGIKSIYIADACDEARPADREQQDAMLIGEGESSKELLRCSVSVIKQLASSVEIYSRNCKSRIRRVVK